jgi:ribosome biogenesis GTPase A
MESPDIDVFKLKLRPPPLFNQKDNDMILGAKYIASSITSSIKEKIDKDNDRLYDSNKLNNIPNVLSINQNNNEPIEINEVMKILIVGNAKCGKSSIINRYTSNSFESKYKTTIGADFIRKDGKIF